MYVTVIGTNAGGASDRAERSPDLRPEAPTCLSAPMRRRISPYPVASMFDPFATISQFVPRTAIESLHPVTNEWGHCELHPCRRVPAMKRDLWWLRASGGAARARMGTYLVIHPTFLPFTSGCILGLDDPGVWSGVFPNTLRTALNTQLVGRYNEIQQSYLRSADRSISKPCHQPSGIRIAFLLRR